MVALNSATHQLFTCASVTNTVIIGMAKKCLRSLASTMAL